MKNGEVGRKKKGPDAIALSMEGGRKRGGGGQLEIYRLVRTLEEKRAHFHGVHKNRKRKRYILQFNISGGEGKKGVR